MPYRQYSSEAVEKALQSVREGSSSLRQASKDFGIPFTTLQQKHTGVYPVKTRSGPSSVFTEQEEKALVQYTLARSRQGFPITRSQLLDAAQELVTKLGKETPFVDNRPSKHWYKSFLSRNPELTEKLSQSLTKRRANVTESSIRQWFSSIENYLRERSLLNIGPRRIFNLDESSFKLNPTGVKVLVSKDDRAAYNVCNSDKEAYTVLVTGNAAGELVPTMIVYPYQTIPPKISRNFPDEFRIGKSSSGWMTAETFYMFIANVFHPWCVENQIEFPVALFLDGHGSHLNMALSDFCVKNKIELIALYPNATHILQPMDVSVFRTLKRAYEKAVQEWRNKNNLKLLTRYDFAGVVKAALDSLDTKRILANGFRACGLHPFNPDAPAYNKLFNNTLPTISETPQSPPNPPSVFIERFIDPIALQFFKSNNDNEVFNGPIEYKELYKAWLLNKRLVAGQTSIPCTVTSGSDVCITSDNSSEASTRTKHLSEGKFNLQSLFLLAITPKFSESLSHQSQ